MPVDKNLDQGKVHLVALIPVAFLVNNDCSFRTAMNVLGQRILPDADESAISVARLSTSMEGDLKNPNVRFCTWVGTLRSFEF